MPDNKEPNNTDGTSSIPIYKDWILFLATFLIVGADQLTKYFVREYMHYGQSIPDTGFFRLTYYTNSGTIFGLFPNIPVIFTKCSHGTTCPYCLLTGVSIETTDIGFSTRPVTDLV